MSIYELNPVTDRRWTEFVQRHHASSVFHTPAWLKALQAAYRYSPVAFTTSAPGKEIRNAVVFCRVQSWLTGSRLVSLPFSDHCQPLLERDYNFGEFARQLVAICKQEGLRYIEVRPRKPMVRDSVLPFGQSNAFCFHSLDLNRNLNEIWKHFHNSCVQRRIGHAEQAGLSYHEGRSEQHLRKFYQLFIRTRRRQQMPPPPLRWFFALASCLADALTIRLIEKEGLPIAGIITLAHRDTIIYKYGASDERFNHFGATPLLFWKTIQDANRSGFAELDLGRSGYDTPGLIAFKDRLGAVQSSLTYLRYPAPRQQRRTIHDARLPRHVLSLVPSRVLTAAGGLLYRHIG